MAGREPLRVLRAYSKPMINKEILVLLSTCPDVATAERIARELVATSLVACVNVVPGLRSIYRWNGAVQSDEEVLHPYALPEIVALSVADGHHPYLQWVADSTRTP